MIRMRYTIPRSALKRIYTPGVVGNLMDDLARMGEVVGDFRRGEDVTVTMTVDGDLWDACEHWMGTLAELQTYVRPQELPDPRPEIEVLP
jgi:hypothetical protein